MNKVTVREIIEATSGKLLYGNPSEEISGVSTDSRACGREDVFFPIVGEIHDAHKFLPQVKERGCRVIVISREEIGEDYKDINVILVKDTTTALQELAAYYLEKINVKKIAVTGSVGKTTTRDMLYYMIREKYKTGRTVGNFNNDIGLPLTVFTFDDSLEAVVLEMGMDRKGQIHRLAEIARPDVGVITNVGISHIEHLGSRMGIRSAKLEITHFFNENNTLVINESCDMLKKEDITGNYKIVTAGDTGKEDFSVSNVIDRGEKGVDFTICCSETTENVHLNVPGAHNAINASLALAGAVAMGVPVRTALKGLNNLTLTGKRLTVKEGRGIKVIDDTYNAAPESMKSAVKTVINTEGKRKVAILGNMNELGEESARLHYEVGEFAAKQGLDMLITIGDKGEDIAKGAKTSMDSSKVFHFADKDKFFKEIYKLILPGDAVVVKASRSMELEEVVDKIIEEQETK